MRIVLPVVEDLPGSAGLENAFQAQLLLAAFIGRRQATELLLYAFRCFCGYHHLREKFKRAISFHLQAAREVNNTIGIFDAGSHPVVLREQLRFVTSEGLSSDRRHDQILYLDDAIRRNGKTINNFHPLESQIRVAAQSGNANRVRE